MTPHHRDRGPNRPLMYHTDLPSHKVSTLLWRCCHFLSDGLLLTLVTGYHHHPHRPWINHGQAQTILPKRRRMKNERFLKLQNWLRVTVSGWHVVRRPLPPQYSVRLSAVLFSTKVQLFTTYTFLSDNLRPEATKNMSAVKSPTGGKPIPITRQPNHLAPTTTLASG